MLRYEFNISMRIPKRKLLLKLTTSGTRLLRQSFNLKLSQQLKPSATPIAVRVMSHFTFPIYSASSRANRHESPFVWATYLELKLLRFQLGSLLNSAKPLLSLRELDGAGHFTWTYQPIHTFGVANAKRSLRNILDPAGCGGECFCTQLLFFISSHQLNHQRCLSGI